MFNSLRPTLIAAEFTAAVITSVLAAQPAHEAHHQAQPAATVQQGMPEGCAAMMTMRHDMMDRQKEADAKLDHPSCTSIPSVSFRLDFRGKPCHAAFR